MHRSFFILLSLCALAVPAFAQVVAPIPTDPTYVEWVDNLVQEYSFFTISNLWLLIAAAMIFTMHLGFATLEAGLTRAKNTVNIIYKNLFTLSMSLTLYMLFGYNTMYPVETFNGWLHFGGWIGIHPEKYMEVMTSRWGNNHSYWAQILFQAMFAATAAKIVSGAVAERIKLPSFMLFAALLVGLGYPVMGSWAWGEGGWLAKMGFVDFAGGMVIHGVGGFAALAAVIVLGPRLGKYSKDGKPQPILGHNLPLAAIGVYLLWFGWFGFNGGAVASASPEEVGRVMLATALGGATGALSCMLFTKLLTGKLDLSISLNGALAGLVSITAGANSITLNYVPIIGIIAGGLVVVAILFFERVGLDDPVGAISVHGICGAWGTLAVGLFGEANFWWQALGVFSYALTAFVFAFIVMAALKATIGIRPSEADEETGLDIAEHGQEAYTGLP
ncbi:MAG: ammonium transporter, partial [Verrucomicrobiota bacterium]